MAGADGVHFLHANAGLGELELEVVDVVSHVLHGVGQRRVHLAKICGQLAELALLVDEASDGVCRPAEAVHDPAEEVGHHLASRLEERLPLSKRRLPLAAEVVADLLGHLLGCTGHIAEAVLHAAERLDHRHGVVLAERRPQLGGYLRLLVAVGHLGKLAHHGIEHVLRVGASRLESLEGLLRGIGEVADGLVHATVGEGGEELV